MNACLKRLLHNSNITICDLVKEIHVLLDRHDKENEYNFWRLSIPSIKNQEKVNFLFTKVDQCLQRFLGPTMLKMHRDEINQSLYYIANLVKQEEVNEVYSFYLVFYLQAIYYTYLKLNNRNFQMKSQMKQRPSIYYKLP